MTMQVKHSEFPKDSAASYGLARCHCCELLNDSDNSHCQRCGSRLHLRDEQSVTTCLALVITAIIFYIPANTLPIMTTSLLGNDSDSTILGGVLLFFEHGSYFIASVIFTASVLIPIAKMCALLWLCFSIKYAQKLSHEDLSLMYRLVEFIGKWSMIDVFVVAVLVALIQLGGLMAIKPGLATSAFAIVVILTMVAAHQFDIRLIWDKLAHHEQS